MAGVVAPGEIQNLVSSPKLTVPIFLSLYVVTDKKKCRVVERAVVCKNVGLRGASKARRFVPQS